MSGTTAWFFLILKNPDPEKRGGRKAKGKKRKAAENPKDFRSKRNRLGGGGGEKENGGGEAVPAPLR